MIDKANVGGAVHEINDTGARGMISPDVFSTAAAYEAGEYCIYNNTLYKFTEAKSAGAWDDSKASATDIASELSALNSRTPTLKRANIEAEFANGSAIIPFSSIGIDTAPDFAMVQSLYSSGSGVYADSFTVQLAVSTINVYGRTENDQKISGNRILGIFMWFDS